MCPTGMHDSWIGIAVIALGGSYHIWALQRARRMLDEWAQRNRYRLVEARYSFWPGPFWFISKNGAVYQVTVADNSGTRRQAWVFCGYPLTFFHDTVDVRWK